MIAVTADHYKDALLAGNRDAFAHLVEQYQGLVCSVTYSVTGDLDQSEDLAQETFLTAWRSLPELRDWDKLPAWLCGIARNLAHNSLRKRTRDPLFRAAEVPEELSAHQQCMRDELSRVELNRIMWETLSTLPAEYREPLVLFYREGNSTRAVAEALDISEDAVRQRLSRGRKMLRENLAAFIEDSLQVTRPSSAFTMAVLAALPLATTQAAVAGGSAAGVTAGSKGAAGAAAGAVGAGVLGGLAGTLIGISGGFLGMWSGIRNSATLGLRRYMLKSCALMYAYVWLFLGYQALAGILFWRIPGVMAAVCAAGWAVYIALLFVLIRTFSNRGRQILQAAVTETDAAEPGLETGSLSLRHVRSANRWWFTLALSGSAVVVYWIRMMPWTSTLWGAAAAGAGLIHLVYLYVFRMGIRISLDQAAFNSAPPDLGASERLQLLEGKRPLAAAAAGKLTRNRFDAFTLVGSVAGPMAPAFAMAAEQKATTMTVGVAVVSLLVITTGLTLRIRYGRRRVFASVCFFMGAFAAFVFSQVNTAQPHQFGLTGMPGVFQYLPSFVAAGLYWAIGLAIWKNRTED